MPVPTSGRIYKVRKCETLPNNTNDVWCLPSNIQIGDIVQFTNANFPNQGISIDPEPRFVVGVNMEQQANEVCSQQLSNSDWVDLSSNPNYEVLVWMSYIPEEYNYTGGIELDGGVQVIGNASVHPDAGFQVNGTTSSTCTNCCKGASPEDAWNAQSGPGVGQPESWGWNFNWESNWMGGPDVTHPDWMGYKTTMTGPTSWGDGMLDSSYCLNGCSEDNNTVDFTDPGEYDNYAVKPKKQPSQEPTDPQVLRMQKLAGLDTPEEPKK